LRLAAAAALTKPAAALTKPAAALTKPAAALTKPAAALTKPAAAWEARAAVERWEVRAAPMEEVARTEADAVAADVAAAASVE
jgi:hypothetical protein